MLLRGGKMADVKVVPLEGWHLAEIELQPMQAYAATKCEDPRFRATLANNTDGYTMLVDNGEGEKPTIIAVCGVITEDTGLGSAYAFISKHFRKYSLRLTRGIKKFLEEKLATKYHRIESVACVEFEEALRWHHILGFKLESIKKQATVYRQDVALYAMIREGE